MTLTSANAGHVSSFEQPPWLAASAVAAVPAAGGTHRATANDVLMKVPKVRLHSLTPRHPA